MVVGCLVWPPTAGSHPSLWLREQVVGLWEVGHTACVRLGVGLCVLCSGQWGGWTRGFSRAVQQGLDPPPPTPSFSQPLHLYPSWEQPNRFGLAPPPLPDPSFIYPTFPGAGVLILLGGP